MFKKNSKDVDVNKIIRRKKKKDDVERLVITVQDGKTSCVGGISPFDLLMFLGGGFPELFRRLCNSIKEEDGGTLMKLLSVRLALNELHELEEELSKEYNNEKDED